MTFGSICSGIEAASAAWHPLGWQTAWVSEIDTFCCSLLQHHYPDTKNYGDFTQIPASASASRIDVLVGGTPCQSFSVAGLRGGLDDDRGNLALEFCRLVDRLRPRWFVWENVPGVLSSNGGRDFGSILGAMGELGYGTAYRVLDAQFFGVPQRRRRVFVVGYLGDWRRAAAVLFERHSLSGHPPPSREKRQRPTGSAQASIGVRCESKVVMPDICPTLRSGGNQTGGDRPPGTDVDTCDSLIAFTDVVGALSSQPGMKQTSYVAIGLDEEQNAVVEGIGTLKARKEGGGFEGSVMTPTAAVRRLTPRECELLQGFSPGYTLIPVRGKPSADGPRYKALGNSMAVPVMRWIGERIQKVDKICQTHRKN